MTALDGFHLERGEVADRIWSTVSSTATFLAGNPVALSDDGSVIEATSDVTEIYGIALNDAADSFAGAWPNQVLVELPLPSSQYRTKVQTGVAASATSVGQGYGLEKSGNYLRVDTDSQATPHVKLMPGPLGTNPVRSDDSSVLVAFLAHSLGVLPSASSSGPMAQD